MMRRGGPPQEEGRAASSLTFSVPWGDKILASETVAGLKSRGARESRSVRGEARDSRGETVAVRHNRDGPQSRRCAIARRKGRDVRGEV